MQKLSDYKMPEIMSRKGKMNKVLSSIVTALVIGLLVFLGPVNALQLSLSGINSNAPYIAGETISFTGKIDIETNERPEIRNVSVMINGQEACTIDIWGWVLHGCEGVNVTLIEYATSFGYGYGYNVFNGGNGSYEGYGYSYGYHQGKSPGYISYNVTIDTSNGYIGTENEPLVAPYLWYGGNNKVKLLINTEQQVLDSAEHIIWLNPAVQGKETFEMNYPPLNLTLAGTYDSKERTFEGYLTVGNDSSINYIGVGSYVPYDSDSGEINLRLYDNTRNNDPGIFWYGNYSDGIWYLSPDPKMSEYLEGIMISAPQ
jgi:hypothetical protein